MPSRPSPPQMTNCSRTGPCCRLGLCLVRVGGQGGHSEGRLWAPALLHHPQSQDNGFPWCPFCPVPGVSVGLSPPDGASRRSELPISEAGAPARSLSCLPPNSPFSPKPTATRHELQRPGCLQTAGPLPATGVWREGTLKKECRTSSEKGREGTPDKPACLFGTRGRGEFGQASRGLLPLSWGMLAMSSAPALSIFPFPLQAWAETSPIQCM